MDLNVLYKDLIVSIFIFLDLKDVSKVASVCKKFNLLIKDDQIWECWFNREFRTQIFGIGLCCSEDIIQRQTSWIERFKQALKQRQTERWTIEISLKEKCDSNAIFWILGILVSKNDEFKNRMFDHHIIPNVKCMTYQERLSFSEIGGINIKATKGTELKANPA